MMAMMIIKRMTRMKRSIVVIALAVIPVLADGSEEKRDLRTWESPQYRVHHINAAQLEKIFSDDFESGGIEAWYRVAGGDCELLMSQVPDCDLDLGLGGWVGSPPANVFWVDDDSDGDATSGALEMVVDPSIGASMTLCFPKIVPGQAYIDGYVDVKVMSGSLSTCWAESAVYSGTDCSGQLGWMQSYFLPASSFWKPHWLGGLTAGDNIKTLRMTLRCSGDATIRFDDVIKTPLDIVVVP